MHERKKNVFLWKDKEAEVKYRQNAKVAKFPNIRSFKNHFRFVINVRKLYLWEKQVFLKKGTNSRNKLKFKYTRFNSLEKQENFNI